MCFNGEPKLMLFDIGLCLESGSHSKTGRRRLFDMNMLPMDEKIITRKPHYENLPISIKEFKQMKEYAAILSKPFRHVRVDFYCISSKIVLGEMTFYHTSAYNDIRPFEFDIELGSWIDIAGL